MQEKTAIIVANAPIRWTRELASLATNGDPLVAADGGANALASLGLRPSWVIGDLDSITPECRAWIGENRMLERPDQDRTDLDKTLSFVIDENEAKHTIVLGAIGGRVDHEIGNLGILAARSLGPRLVFRQTHSATVALTGSLKLEAVPGETWSFFTFDPAVRVSLKGVRWPLEETPIDAGNRPSISNLAVEDRIQVSAHGGPVIAVRYFSS